MTAIPSPRPSLLSPLPAECFTCEVTARSQPVPGALVWDSALVVANHLYDPDPYTQYRSSPAGWIVVSPARHVTRVFELSSEEWNELGLVVRSVDAALTELYGSKRTMVASLGRGVPDHVHVHCVPTFNDEFTLGYLNFDSAFVPVPSPSAVVASRVREYLLENLSSLTV